VAELERGGIEGFAPFICATEVLEMVLTMEDLGKMTGVQTDKIDSSFPVPVFFFFFFFFFF
jgi:hypothetical protein